MAAFVDHSAYLPQGYTHVYADDDDQGEDVSRAQRVEPILCSFKELLNSKPTPTPIEEVLEKVKHFTEG